METKGDESPRVRGYRVVLEEAAVTTAVAGEESK